MLLKQVLNNLRLVYEMMASLNKKGLLTIQILNLRHRGEATADDLINEKRRLEEVIGRLNIDIKDKNEKIIDLLEQIEDLKINVYSRDKAVELLQN